MQYMNAVQAIEILPEIWCLGEVFCDRGCA